MHNRGAERPTRLLNKRDGGTRGDGRAHARQPPINRVGRARVRDCRGCAWERGYGSYWLGRRPRALCVSGRPSSRLLLCRLAPYSSSLATPGSSHCRAASPPSIEERGGGTKTGDEMGDDWQMEEKRWTIWVEEMADIEKAEKKDGHGQPAWGMGGLNVIATYSGPWGILFIFVCL